MAFIDFDEEEISDVEEEIPIADIKSADESPWILRWGMATFAGCLNGAAFILYGPLTLLANLPLLWALRSARSGVEAAFLGAWVGFIGGMHIYGVVEYGWWIFWAFSLYTASQMTLYGWVVYQGWGRVGERFHPALGRVYDLLLPVMIWTVTEWIRTLGPLALPASYVGCIADISWLSGLLSWASVVGGLGVSALIALICSALFICSVGWALEDQGKAWLTLGGYTLLGILILSIVGIFTLGYDRGKGVKVAALQGGFSNAYYQAAKVDAHINKEIIDTYEHLLQKATDRKADLAIWGESAIRVPLLQVDELRKKLLPSKLNTPWILGGLSHVESDGQRYNMAVSVAQSLVRGKYKKVRLVPGVEKEFTPGNGWTPLSTPWGKIGVMICFESIYPEIGRTLALAKANLLVVLSNDAGFGYTPISHHMSNRAIVRAVESQRWLVRVGQAGVSMVVDPWGRIQGRLGLFEADVLMGKVHFRQNTTLYTQWGYWWLWPMLCFFILPIWPRFRWKNLRYAAMGN